MARSGGGGGPQWPNPAVPLACEGALLAPLPYITAEEVAVKAFVARAAEEAQTADADPVRATLQYVDAAAQEAALLALEGACAPPPCAPDPPPPLCQGGWGLSTVHTAPAVSSRRHLTFVVRASSTQTRQCRSQCDRQWGGAPSPQEGWSYYGGDHPTLRRVASVRSHCRMARPPHPGGPSLRDGMAADVPQASEQRTPWTRRVRR
jgi:hypothetical protein